MTETELAWAAGFFDGEGHSCVKTDRGRTYFRMAVGQVYRPSLDRFHRAVESGTICGPYRRPGAQPCWRWQATGARTATKALDAIWPYLGASKRHQALIALILADDQLRGPRMHKKPANSPNR